MECPNNRDHKLLDSTRYKVWNYYCLDCDEYFYYPEKFVYVGTEDIEEIEKFKNELQL